MLKLDSEGARDVVLTNIHYKTAAMVEVHESTDCVMLLSNFLLHRSSRRQNEPMLRPTRHMLQIMFKQKKRPHWALH